MEGLKTSPIMGPVLHKECRIVLLLTTGSCGAERIGMDWKLRPGTDCNCGPEQIETEQIIFGPERNGFFGTDYFLERNGSDFEQFQL